jgi:hypothetical protein
MAQLNRKPLTINPKRKTRKQEFSFNTNLGYKSKANPSIVTWASPGKGVQGESVNSQNNASKLIINRNWKPL